MAVTQEPHYGLYTGMVGGFTDRVEAVHIQQLSTMLALVGNRLAQCWGAGVLAAADFNGIAGTWPNYSVGTGVAIVGDPGQEVVRALTAPQPFTLVASTTNYFYLTKGFQADGQPVIVQRNLAADPAAATPNPDTLQLIRVVTGAATITTQDFAPPSRVNLPPPGRGTVSVTAAYTITDRDAVVLANAAGGAFTVTLPSPVGRRTLAFTIKRTSTGGNAVAVTGTSVDGVTTKTLGSQYAAITVVSDGAAWWIVNQLGTVT